MRDRLAGLLKSAQLSLFDPEPLAITPPPAPPAKVPVATPALPGSGGKSRELLMGEHRIGYELRRARRRSIGFSVSAEGLRVSAPRWVPIPEIENALLAKQGWILRKLVEQRERAARLQSNRIAWADGCTLPYLGAPLRLELAAGVRSAALCSERPGVLLMPLPAAATPAQMQDAVQAWLQRQARALFQQRCEHFAAQLGVSMTRLSLSSAQTRWGSASASGSIRLNWRLIHFAPAVIDYVVAHELAHLREMNHSERFWAVVRSVLPDYEQMRSRLRDEALPLFDA